MRFFLTRAVSVALPIAAAVAFSSTADAAPSWAPPTVLGPAVSDNGMPDIAVAPDGEAIATWVGSRPERIVVSSRRPGKGWSPPVAIASIGEEVQGPRIAMSADKAVVVWSDNIHTRSGETRVILAATRLRGKPWSRPRNISAEKRWYEEPYGSEPQVAMTRSGKAIVIWQAENEKHRTVSFVGSATQAAAGTDWTPPVGIRGSYEAEEPQLAISPAGEAVAIWGAYYNEESKIGVSSRPASGPWKSASLLSTPGPFPEPRIAMTTRGEAVGTWAKAPEGGLESTVQVTMHTPGGKWRVKSLLPQDYGTGPEIVTEPGGRATVVWSNFVSFEEHALVSSTHAPGAGWSEPRSLAAEGLQLPSPSASLIAVTRQGESIALWIADGPLGKRTTLLSATRRRPQPWSEPHRVPTSPCGQLYGAPELALAPNGRAFAVWRCFNGTRWIITAATRPAAGSGS
jgi:hypothetical protein